MIPANAVEAMTLSIGRLNKKVTINDMAAANTASGNQRFIASSFLCIIWRLLSPCLIYRF
jgi:hypothetical protein